MADPSHMPDRGDPETARTVPLVRDQGRKTLLPLRLAVNAAASSGTSDLPDDILRAAIRRVRIAALAFATVFFMANFMPPLLLGNRWEFFSDPNRSLPGAISILLSVLIFIGLRHVRHPSRAIDLGLAWAVVGSYGIAFAEFWNSLRYDVPDPDARFVGLSWVAVWMASFAVLLPAKPWKSIAALAVAAAAVPLVSGLELSLAPNPIPLSAAQFLLGLAFPYFLAGMLAHAGARVVYQLGRDVRSAREIGSYTLEERLGSGGMGEVWKARHRLLARPAAIKLIRRDVMGEAVIARFEREAQATAQLCSPHTIDLYDFGVAPDGSFYYVMELLNGLDLDSFVRRFGPQPAGRVVHILRQIAASLAEAHERGLYHRDIKPANIYLCRYGRETDFVKVLDFGLVSSAGLPTDVSLTVEHRITGTPGFMAPEQVLADRPVDGRTDLYALGCVGYWLLTGSLVFEGDTLMKTLLQHVHDAPVPPSARTEVGVPGELDQALLACLAKSQEDRPRDADAFAASLSGAWVPPWDSRNADEWWRLHMPESRSGA